MLQGPSTDYTLIFRTLSRYNADRTALLKLDLYHKPMNGWLNNYDQRVLKNTSSVTPRHANMLQTNPKFVLKNYILQEAIDAAKEGIFTVVDTLF